MISFPVSNISNNKKNNTKEYEVFPEFIKNIKTGENYQLFPILQEDYIISFIGIGVNTNLNEEEIKELSNEKRTNYNTIKKEYENYTIITDNINSVFIELTKEIKKNNYKSNENIEKKIKKYKKLVNNQLIIKIYKIILNWLKNETNENVKIKEDKKTGHFEINYNDKKILDTKEIKYQDYIDIISLQTKIINLINKEINGEKVDDIDKNFDTFGVSKYYNRYDNDEGYKKEDMKNLLGLLYSAYQLLNNNNNKEKDIIILSYFNKLYTSLTGENQSNNLYKNIDNILGTLYLITKKTNDYNELLNILYYLFNYPDLQKKYNQYLNDIVEDTNKENFVKNRINNFLNEGFGISKYNIKKNGNEIVILRYDDVENQDNDIFLMLDANTGNEILIKYNDKMYEILEIEDEKELHKKVYKKELYEELYKKLIDDENNLKIKISEIEKEKIETIQGVKNLFTYKDENNIIQYLVYANSEEDNNYLNREEIELERKEVNEEEIIIESNSTNIHIKKREKIDKKKLLKGIDNIIKENNTDKIKSLLDLFNNNDIKLINNSYKSTKIISKENQKKINKKINEWIENTYDNYEKKYNKYTHLFETMKEVSKKIFKRGIHIGNADDLLLTFLQFLQEEYLTSYDGYNILDKYGNLYKIIKTN